MSTKEEQIMKLTLEFLKDINEDTGYGEINIILKGEQPVFIEKVIKHKI